MSNKPSVRKHALLDIMLTEFSLKTDSALADFIGVLPAQICKYRAGTPISDSTRVKILRKTSWPIHRLDAAEAGKK